MAEIAGIILGALVPQPKLHANLQIPTLQNLARAFLVGRFRFAVYEEREWGFVRGSFVWDE
jgi:hypothetical protein